MSLKRNFIWMLTSKISIISATIFTGALINRSLGPSGRGVFAEIQTWVSLFIVIFGLSIDSAIYHFANRTTYGIDDKSRFMTISVLSLIYSIAAIIGLVFCVAYRPNLLSKDAMHNLILISALLVSTMLATNSITFLEAIGNIKFSAVLGALQAFLNIFIIAFGYRMNAIDVKFVIVRSIALQITILGVMSVYFLKMGFMAGNFSKKMASGMIRAGAKQHIGTVATFIYTRINQLIVFKYCGAAEAGIFAVALNLVFALIFIPQVFRVVLYPRVIHSNDELDITIKSLRFWFYAWGIFTVLILFSAKPLLLIYGGGSFLLSVKSFRILMLGMWFLPLTSLIAPYYMKKGAFLLVSSVAVIRGIICIGMNMLLVPRYASEGAAISTSVTCIAGFCLVLLFFYFFSNKSPIAIFNPYLFGQDCKQIL